MLNFHHAFAHFLDTFADILLGRSVYILKIMQDAVLTRLGARLLALPFKMQLLQHLPPTPEPPNLATPSFLRLSPCV
jgi:hypothetical protein